MIGGVFAAAIDVLLIGVGFAFLGWTAFEAGQQLGRFIYLSATATNVTALDEAAEALARVIVLIGVEALLVLLTKAAIKAHASHIRETGPAGGQPRPLNSQPNSRTAARPARQNTKIGTFASLRRLTASEANSAHVKAGRRPPYAADGVVDEVRIMEDKVFARVHGADNKARSWMMASEDIRGLSAVEIKNRYALPDLPMFVSDVKVPAGTIVRSGEVAPQAGWGSGGATQFELMQRLPESAFINTRPL